MIRPVRLRPGDAVRLVAPCGPVPREALEAGAAVLRRRYEVRFDEGLFAREGFLAGPDERRLEELLRALAEPDVKAVIVARGGYGLARLLPFLEPAFLQAGPRVLAGFSDATSLLAYAQRADVVSVHGPVVTQLGRLSDVDQGAFFKLLEDPAPGILLAELEPLVPGRVEGRLVGGNLEVLSRLLGTPFAPSFDDAILFLEDLGERPYRVDRLVTHLDLAGVFSRVRAVILGDFSGCSEPEATRAEMPSADAVLEERLSRLTVPVVRTPLFGHGTRNLPLPHGARVLLDTQKGTLVALEGAVS